MKNKANVKNSKKTATVSDVKAVVAALRAAGKTNLAIELLASVRHPVTKKPVEKKKTAVAPPKKPVAKNTTTAKTKKTAADKDALKLTSTKTNAEGLTCVEWLDAAGGYWRELIRAWEKGEDPSEYRT